MNQSGQNQPTTFRSPSSKKSIYKLSTPSWDATKSAWLRLRGIFVPSDNYVLNSFDDDDDDEDSSIVNLRDMAHRSPYSPWSFASNYSYWALRVKLEESRLKKYSANRTRQHRSGRWYSSQNNLQDNMFSLKESQYKYGKISYGALYIAQPGQDEKPQSQLKMK